MDHQIITAAVIIAITTVGKSVLHTDIKEHSQLATTPISYLHLCH